MANTNFLSTSELDFNTIKENFKTYLRGQDQFRDYDFEGSNMSVLLDVLAYNTYLNSFYLNMVGSEMFLDTAQIKESVVSHAKELNYIPRSRASAEALVDITITATDNPDSIVIPQDYAFTTSIDNATFKFYVDQDHIVVANNGVYTASNVAIYEGQLVTEYYDITPDMGCIDANTTLTLQSETIDTRSIRVTVYESSDSSDGYSYTQASSLYGLTGTSNVFFINGYRDNQYQIHFGTGVTGRKINNGSRVKVVYRSTNGTLGNGAYNFSKTSSIVGYSGIIADTVSAAQYGNERESLEAIKFNAPRFFTTQERAVTAQDYINLVMAKFPQFQAVAAYGGEELSPPQYGKVAIALKPYGSTAIVSDALKSQVVEFLNQKNLTTEPIVVDPDILYLVVQSIVKYDTQTATIGLNTLRTNVKNAIVNYGQTNLDKFGTDLSYSKMIASIDDVDPSIIGNETKIKLSKRWSPIPQVTNTISFSFNTELYHEDLLYELPPGHDLIIKTSPFTYVSGNSSYTAYAGDNGIGTLKIYTDVVSGNVMSKVSLNDNAGTVNYYTGDIVLTANVDSYEGSHINITAELLNKDVSIRRNEFLVISAQDVSVTMQPVVE